MNRNKYITSWLSIWLYVFAGVGAALLLVLIINWNQYEWASRLPLMAIIAITLHVWEEERIPGGFTYMFNTLQKSQKPDVYPMNELIAMAVDCSTVLAFAALFFASGGAAWFAITMASFCCLETLIHTGSGFISWRRYRKAGKRTIYVPGSATAWLAFLPIAVGTFWYLTSNGLATGADWLVGIAVAIAVLAVTVKGLEHVLADENSPYAAPEKYRVGYFRKFSHGSE